MGTRIFHGRRLRQYRLSLPGRACIITACCSAREPLFADVNLGRIVVEELRNSDEDSHTNTFAYVVMPDHIHWLLQLKEQSSLVFVVRRVKGRSAIRVNKVRLKAGPVWQRGYHDRLVPAEESLETVGDYIVQNPVRAGLVKDVDDYPLWDVMWRRWTHPVRG